MWREQGKDLSHMKTKKALGALLGLLGSLPAFPLRPLAAGFSAPLLFTANLQQQRWGDGEGSKSNLSTDPSRERGKMEKSSLGVGPGDALRFGPLHGGFLREQQRRRSDPREADRIGRESRANWEGGEAHLWDWAPARGGRREGKRKGGGGDREGGTGDKKAETRAEGHIISAKGARTQPQI
jgi:hypothetical protein